MVRSIDVLKAHARRLHHRARAGEPRVQARLRPALSELRPLDDAALAAAVRRRHVLALLARELGYAGWPHASDVLRGRRADDFGTLLYPPGASAHWNVWSAQHAEARAIRAEHGGVLLAYKRHYFIVESHFLATLGLDPDDPDWDRMGRDWARPSDLDARDRLQATLLRRRFADE